MMIGNVFIIDYLLLIIYYRVFITEYVLRIISPSTEK